MGKDGPEWRERKIYGKRMKEKNERKEWNNYHLYWHKGRILFKEGIIEIEWLKKSDRKRMIEKNDRKIMIEKNDRKRMIEKEWWKKNDRKRMKEW